MSVLWPDVSTDLGRRRAIRRGVLGGLVITLISAAAPPPLGFLSLVVFGFITLGMLSGQVWAARAGIIAAFTPLVVVAQQPDSALIFGAFFQCFILAYFFFNAWRGLRVTEKPGVLSWASAAVWLALGLAFVWASYTCANRFPVPAGTLSEVFLPGDWVLLEAVNGAPKANDVLLLAPTAPNTPPLFHRVTVADKFEPAQVLGRATWIAWSDTTQPTDTPLAFYTKARWGRFPRRVRWTE
jgi:MFS family permease